ncbi:hypothetical protein D3C71_432690 [compost metagenome]
MAAGDGNYLLPPRQAHGGGGGILQGRGQVKQLGPPLAAGGLQGGGDQPLLVHRQPHHLILQLARIAQHAGVAEPLAKEGLPHAAGGQQGQHDAVLGAMAEQQPLFTPLDALRGEPVDEQLALFGTSRLLVIAEQAVEIPVRQFGQHGFDDGGPVQLHRQVLPQLDALIVLVADHPFVGGIRRSPDPGAMTHPGRQQTPSLGLGVGTGDGAHSHPQPVCKGPVGR